MNIFNRRKAEAKEHQSQGALPPMTHVAFAGRLWEEAALDPHYALVGATGSGKTLNVRMLMRTALFDSRGALRRHAIIFDAKKEWLPLLRGMAAPAKAEGHESFEYAILNPLDRRRVSWNLAQDITTRISTRQLSEYLIPVNDKLSQPFFADSARLVLGAVLNTFVDRAPGLWTLRDIIEACATVENLDRVLGAEHYGKAVHERFICAKSGPDVEATLFSRLGAFTEVAACGHAQPGEAEPLSLTKWLEGEPSILIIGTDEQAEAALGPLNRVLFRRLFELLSSRLEVAADKVKPVWLFIDEARLAGRLDGIDHVLLKGRSKGVHVVLTCQEVQGLHHVYGKERAEELLSQCTNRAALRTSNAETKSWFVKSIGDWEAQKTTHGQTYSQNPSRSESFSSRIEAPILGSEFSELPRPTPETGVHGFFDIPGQGWNKVGIAPAFTAAHLGRSDSRTDDGFLPWEDSSRQVLQPWNQDDIERLGLTDVEPLTRKKSKKVKLVKWHNMLSES